MITQDSELDTFLDGKICPILEGNGGCIKEDCLAFHEKIIMGWRETSLVPVSIIYSCNICKWEFKSLVTEEYKKEYIKENYK